MKKSYKNFISISILIFVMCVLIITVTTIQKPNTLTAGNEINNSNNSEQEETKTFNYIPAKTSYNQNIAYENNFGGSNTDQVFEVFNLNNYYIIGTTLSQDYYLTNNTSNALFILVCDYYGNATSIFTFTQSKPITFVSSKIFGNSIYTLIKSDGYKLVEFNLSTNLFNTVFSSNANICSLIVSSEPIVAEQSLENTTFNFVLSNTQVSTNLALESIMLSTEYLNGTLLMINTQTDFVICTLTQNGLNIVKTQNNCNLQTFNITDKNFVLLLKTTSGFNVQLLDLTFNVVNEIKLSNTGTNFTLHYLNNTHYLFYLNNNNLNLISFCNHGDMFLNNTIESGVTKFNVLLLNNNFIVATENNNSLNVLKLNLICEKTDSFSVNFNTQFNVNYFNVTHNLNYIAIGNFNGINNVISNCFGNTDVFVLELKNI